MNYCICAGHSQKRSSSPSRSIGQELGQVASLPELPACALWPSSTEQSSACTCLKALVCMRYDSPRSLDLKVCPPTD